MNNIEYIAEILEKFKDTFTIKYEYDNIGIIKKFRIDSRKNLEYDEEKWCRLFLMKSCLNYCAKFILLRYYEDRGIITSKFNEKGINLWNNFVKNIRNRYDTLYNIAIIDMKNDENNNIQNIFSESDYDIYEIDKELAKIVVKGLLNTDFSDIEEQDLVEIFRVIYPLDLREEMRFQDFYYKAPALEYILKLD